MLPITILIFALLLWTTHYFARNLLFAPELFLGLWLLSLVGLLLSGDTFYPIPVEAYLVYIVGGAAFALGGILAFGMSPRAPRPPPYTLQVESSPRTLAALDVLTVVLAIGLPLYWREMSQAVDSEDALLLNAIREAQLGQRDAVRSFSLILNLNILAQFTAMAMVFESTSTRGRKLRTALAVLLALVYGVMDGSKSTAIVLLMSLAFISSLRSRRFKLSALAAAATSSLVLFAVGLLLVQFAFATFGDTWDVIDKLGSTIQLYWLGGMVAFGAIAVDPHLIQTTRPIDRFFLETARSLGWNVDVPPLHAEFLPVGFHAETNVYTIYFTYFKDNGWIPTVVIMLALGTVMSLFYKRAMEGRPIELLLFAQLEIGVVYSVGAENLLTSLNRLLKFVVFLVVLYRILPAGSRLVPTRYQRAISGPS